MIQHPQIHIVRNTRGSFVGRTIISSDHHTPFESKEKTKKLDELTKEFKPDRYVMLGDVGDTMLASRFVEHCLIAASQKLKMPDTASEFTYMVNYMDKRAEVARKANPKVSLFYEEGNHEWRIYRALDKVRHLIGMNYDPIANAFAASKFKWTKSGHFPDGKVIICDDPKNLIVAKHAGKGTAHGHSAATWRHNVAIDYSIIYGDSHKTQKFEGVCSPNVALRDNRFALGIGGVGNWSDSDGFGYATEETRAFWDGGVACIEQHKSGKIEIWVEYL